MNMKEKFVFGALLLWLMSQICLCLLEIKIKSFTGRMIKSRTFEPKETLTGVK